MTRCRAYRRSSGLFIYHGVRCILELEAPGRWIDPRAMHRWGRIAR